ncbi:MAG: hypothetical protein GY798_10400 [Hyphomicrobiales bacterium]|nr:hypothetical protein [Hyphomicrobiales bacterium]
MQDSRRSSRATPGKLARNAGALSRRDFVTLGVGLAALASLGACSGPGAIPDPRSAFRILRPEDLLSLHFEFRNLRIESNGRLPARLVRIDETQDAFVLVRFPGQHIAEEAFNEARADQAVIPPVGARIAQPTRLVFRVPSDIDSLALTLESLLDWDGLEHQIADSGVEVEGPELFAAGSRIEMPVGLALSPAPAARWAHAAKPVTHNGRTELWHTRLTPADGSLSTSVNILAPGYAPPVDWETALEDADRRSLIGRSAEARILILSPMGGWLDLRGRWQTQTAADIARWEHLAAAGQDQRVIVERQDGFLYPFGHRATVMSVTERKVEDTPPTGSASRLAVLRKRDFVVIKEPQVTYRPGEMAMQALTARSLVTPALQIADKTAAAFWIETSPAMPYPFRFTGRDWADGEQELEMPAVFVQAGVDADTAAAIYEDEAHRDHRETGLRGQSAAVAKFEPSVDENMDDPSANPRSAGDTILNLLALQFAAVPDDSGEPGRRFRCTTAAMLARIPSLEPFLDEAQNRGWFELIDPDAQANRGEVFARALPSEPNRIPMYFDQQADRSGGLAAPSFDVDGLSRIHGPVGNADLIMSGGALDGTNYFNDERATLLGGFPLAGLLSTDSGSRSPAVPRIDFIIGRKQPDEEDDDEDDEDQPKEDAEADGNPDPQSEEPAYWEVGLGLSWSVALGPFGTGSLVSFAPVLDDDDVSTSKLEIEVKATRKLGQQTNPTPEDEEAADNDAREESDEKPSGSAVNLTASGKITNFALVLNVSETDTFSIGFEHISVKLGPPKPEKEKTADESPDEPADDPADREEKTTEPSIAPEVEFRLSTIDATGGLNLLKKVIEAAASLPPLPDLPKGEAPTAYPAKMPGAGGADLNVSLGPFEAPKFKLMQFTVSNVTATVGIGLNFLPRSRDPSEPPVVPDNVFSLRVASADKPLTLLSAPWGGIAHLGLNFTPKAVTGFQFSLGVVNKTEFDLGVTKATCEGSLAVAFTYWLDGDGDHYQLDVILKLSGQARLAFLDIHLTLTAIGSVKDELWSFYAELVVRVQISFFTAQASFSFYHEIADTSRRTDPLLTSGPAAGEDDPLTEAEWTAYRSAFAEAT